MTKRLMKSKEAAQYLCISERTLWTLRDEGKIRAFKMKKVVRYDLSDLDEFIRLGKTKI